MYLKNAINQSMYSYCERFHTQLVWVFLKSVTIFRGRDTFFTTILWSEKSFLINQILFLEVRTRFLSKTDSFQNSLLMSEKSFFLIRYYFQRSGHPFRQKLMGFKIQINQEIDLLIWYVFFFSKVYLILLSWLSWLSVTLEHLAFNWS